MTNTTKNEYDQTKNLLNKIRKIMKTTPDDMREQLTKSTKILTEQIDSEDGDEFDSMRRSVSSWMDEHPYEKSDPLPATSNPQSPAPNTQPATPGNQSPTPNPQSSTGTSEKSDFAVINNVEVVINSDDEFDFKITDEEKGKISQLIDDFRSEVSEICEFGKLNIYDNSAKLDGTIKEINIGFTLSAGDDNGVFLSQLSLIMINDNTVNYITKLKNFQPKFNDTMNTLLANRQQN